MESYLDLLQEFTSGYHVACQTAAEVYERKESVLKTRIAFLDVNLASPAESGLDVAHWLRSNGYQGKIYFLTGQVYDSELTDKIKAMNADILAKPFDIDKFIQIIDDGSEDTNSSSV